MLETVYGGDKFEVLMADSLHLNSRQHHLKATNITVAEQVFSKN